MLETELAMKMQEMEEIKEAYSQKIEEFKKSPNIEELEEMLRIEREHNGVERIAKLENMLFISQTNLSKSQANGVKLKSMDSFLSLLSPKKWIFLFLFFGEKIDEIRKLSENAPLNELETIEFLSKTIRQKDVHINVEFS